MLNEFGFKPLGCIRDERLYLFEKAFSLNRKAWLHVSAEPTVYCAFVARNAVKHAPKVTLKKLRKLLKREML